MFSDYKSLVNLTWSFLLTEVELIFVCWSCYLWPHRLRLVLGVIFCLLGFGFCTFSNRDGFISCFPIYMLSYSFPDSLCWLELLVLCWMALMTVDIFDLFPITGKSIQSVTRKYNINCRFSYTFFIKAGESSFMLIFSEDFSL